MVFNSLPAQLEEYGRFEEETHRQIAEVEGSIRELKERLAVEKQIRRQKEDYEALAKGEGGGDGGVVMLGG